MNFKSDFQSFQSSDNYVQRIAQALAAFAGALLLTGDDGPEQKFVRPVI